MVKVSYIIATYKGAKKIESLLCSIKHLEKAILAEFIFVIDGEIDQTKNIIDNFARENSKLDIKVIVFKENKGISAARNAGSKAAKGKILSFTDDDCVLPVNHLKDINKIWEETPESIAIAGDVDSYENKTLNHRFLLFDRPLRVYFKRERNNIFSKLANYFANKEPREKEKVESLLGANFSIKKERLEELGYFDESIKFGGDETYLSNKINNKYGLGSIVYRGDWRVFHKFEESFKDSLRRAYSYAKSNGRRFALKESSLNIAPTPAILIFSAIFFYLLTYNIISGIIFMLFVNTMLWIKNNSLNGIWSISTTVNYLLNPVLKLLTEISDNLGFIRGFFNGKILRFNHLIPIVYRELLGRDAKIDKKEFRFKERDLSLLSIEFIGISVLISAINIYFSNTILGIYLAIALPYILGSLILSGAKKDYKGGTLDIFYSFATGISIILFSGLFISKMHSALNLDFYTGGNIVKFYDIIIILLTIYNIESIHKVSYIFSTPKFKIKNIIILIPIILSISGAILLNQSRSGSVAILGVISILILYIFLLIKENFFNYNFAVFSTSLALLYSYSFRGFSLYGWDIQKEDSVAANALVNFGFSKVKDNDAYSSMLSLTTLPSNISKYSGLEIELLFRFFYPLLISLAITGLFNVLARRGGSKNALISIIITIISTTTFESQIFAISRQEVGFFYFIMMLILFFDDSDIKIRRSLFVLASISLAVSHYTTAYVTIFIMACAYLFALRDKKERKKNLLTGRLLIIFIGTTLLWNFVITRPGTEVIYASSTISSTGIAFLDNQEENILKSWIIGTGSRLGDYESYHKAMVKRTDEIDWLRKDKNLKNYFVSDSQAPKIKNNIFTTYYNILLILSRQILILVEFLIVISLLIFKRKFKGNLSELIGLSTGALLLSATLRVSSALGGLYNPERGALHSGFIFSLILLPIIPFISKKLLYPFLAVLLLSSLALAPYLFGGVIPAKFSNIGEDHERYIISNYELSAADFLIERSKEGQLIFADRYGAVTLSKFNKSNQLGIINFVLPDLVDKRGFIYLSSTNIKDKRMRGYAEKKISVFTTPYEYYPKVKRRLFDNGEAQIYG